MWGDLLVLGLLGVCVRCLDLRWLGGVCFDLVWSFACFVWDGVFVG